LYKWGAVAAAEVSRADPVNRGTLPGLEKRETWGTRRKTLSGRETGPTQAKERLEWATGPLLHFSNKPMTGLDKPESASSTAST
jgi:hypothetical protein